VQKSIRESSDGFSRSSGGNAIRSTQPLAPGRDRLSARGGCSPYPLVLQGPRARSDALGLRSGPRMRDMRRS